MSDDRDAPRVLDVTRRYPTRAAMRAAREAAERERRQSHGQGRHTSGSRHASGSRHRRQGEPDIPLVDDDGAPLTRRAFRELQRRHREGGPGYVAREIVVVVSLALVLSFAIKTWLVQPFFIPSGSMENTLLVGDRVLVSKLTPSPFTVQRGDIVVFEDPDHWLPSQAAAEKQKSNSVVHDALVFVGLVPSDADNHLIKRVIGLPGDHVKCCTTDGYVTVNDMPIKETYLRMGEAPSIDQFDVTVPLGKLWVMGDHRSNSGDSRYHPLGGDGSQGSVPIDKVVGRASAVVWPANRLQLLGQPSSVFAAVPPPGRTE